MTELDKLIHKHSSLVYKQLHKFFLTDDPEAESIAFEALYNAIENYDASTGNSMSTVATVYIYNALGSYVRWLNRKSKLEVVSYNNVAYSDESDVQHEFVDMLCSNSTPETSYIEKECLSEVYEAFDYILNKIGSASQKEIILEWKKSDFSIKSTDIAVKLGVSQSYVSQTISKFRNDIKKYMEVKYGKCYRSY